MLRALSILVLYLVLGILNESFAHPLTILSGLPSEGFGALVTLLFRIELNVYAFVGLIMLIAIVKKNAIGQIDFALDAQRSERKLPLDAITEGCLIRFPADHDDDQHGAPARARSCSGVGAGADSRRPLGLAVVGGFFLLAAHYALPDAGRYTYPEAAVAAFRRCGSGERRSCQRRRAAAGS